MISKKMIVTVGLLFLALTLTGCAVGPRADSAPGLSTDGESIYFANRTFVYKINPTGTELWHYPEKSSASVVFYAAPFSQNGTVVFGDLANNLHALSSDNGSVKWQFAESKGWYLAAAAGEPGLIVAPSLDRSVYALDDTGQLLWKFDNKFGFLAQPLITEERIIIASQEHEVIALNKETGAQVWRTKTAGSMDSSPVFDPITKLLFAGGLGHEVVALDEVTGATKWTFNHNGQMSAIWASPILMGDNLIVTDDKGVIYSINSENGNLNWSIVTNEAMMAGPVALDNGFAVVSIAGNVRAYDLNQVPLWTLSLPDAQVYTTPVIAGGNIIIANKTTKTENLVFAVDQNGVQKWAFTPSAN
ncbi:MAG: PQQ-binding-like beta-propeller repeat protein [Anaerolineaceae bacterium]